MPDSPHLPGDRFFARLRSFDMECPSCGTVYVVRPTSVARSRNVRTNRDTHAGLSVMWNDVLQRFRCTACKTPYGLGIVAWPLRGGLRPAADSLPTKRQAQQLRAMAGGWFLRTTTATNDSRNVRVTQPCACQPDTRFVNPACPVHGEIKGHIPAAPQKVWGGSLPNKPRKKPDYDDE